MSPKTMFSAVFLVTLTTSPRALSAPATYRIAGIAVDSRNGAPVPFCRLRLASDDSPAAGGDRGRNAPGRDGFGRGPEQVRGGAVEDVLLADAHGRFSLPVEHAGRWRLSGAARGYRNQFLNEHGFLHETLVLSAQQPVANVTLRLDADAEISGLVLDEAGEPVRQAQVTAEDLSPEPVTLQQQPRVVGFTQTDDFGHYEMASLAPGAYRLRVQARPWYAEGSGSVFIARNGAAPAASPLDPSLDVVYPLTYYPGKDEERLAETLNLNGGERRQADFHLQPIPATHLVLPRPPSSGAADQQNRGFPLVVGLSGDGEYLPLNARSGPIVQTDSSWNVGGLSPGLYEVRLPDSDGGPGETQQFEVKPGSGGTVELPSASLTVPVTLASTGGEARSLGMVTFTETTTGQTVTNGGRNAFGGRRSGRDDEGPRVVRLAPGTFKISALGTGESYVTGLSVTGEGAQQNGMTVTVTSGSPTLVFALARGRATLTGTAADGAAPAAAAMALLIPVAETGQAQRAETASDGSFTFGAIVPGPHILVVIEDGWGVNWHDAATLARYLPQGLAVDVEPGSKTSLQVAAVRP